MKLNVKWLLTIRNAFFYSISGLKYLLKERPFRQELIFGFILVIFEFFRNLSSPILMYLFSSYMLILMAETINSAIETMIDRISSRRHELSKKAKDIGSSLVFIAILHFGIVWIFSFFLT